MHNYHLKQQALVRNRELELEISHNSSQPFRQHSEVKVGLGYVLVSLLVWWIQS